MLKKSLRLLLILTTTILFIFTVSLPCALAQTSFGKLKSFVDDWGGDWIAVVLFLFFLFLLFLLSKTLTRYLPIKSKKGKKGKARKKSGKFKFPDEINIYEKNAFQLLGLVPQKTSISTITTRKDQLLGLIDVGLDPKEHIKDDFYIIPWPYITKIMESDVRNAHWYLEDKLKAIKQELFWFHIEEDNTSSFDHLLKGNFQEGQDLWEKEKSDNPGSYAGALALHNLAILQHAQTIDQEKAIKNSPNMSRKLKKEWEKSFDLWRDVCENEKCLDYFKKRSAYLNVPQIDDEYIRKLHQDLPIDVLKVNLGIARAALNQKKYKYARHHIDLIKNSGFEEKSINQILDELFFGYNKELANIIDLLEDFPDDDHDGIVEKVHEIKEIGNKIGGSDYLSNEISHLKPLLRHRTCFFCGKRTADPNHELIVNMHRVTGTTYTMVYFDTREITVPRCASDKYSTSSSNHHLVKQAIKEGFSFGAKPPTAY